VCAGEGQVCGGFLGTACPKDYDVLMTRVISVIQLKEAGTVLEYVNVLVVQVKDRVVEEFSELYVQRV